MKLNKNIQKNYENLASYYYKKREIQFGPERLKMSKREIAAFENPTN